MAGMPANYDLHNLPDPRELFDLIEVCLAPPLCYTIHCDRIAELVTGLAGERMVSCDGECWASREVCAARDSPLRCGVQVVGTGTYGEVYKARHKRTGELTAIKVLELIEVSVSVL